ncbi:MAG: hypothetical protein P9L91_06840 [Candidatus Zophobacter franzmannii]|nr:hypothetical protein [Candidatus Zophobacter franzmannii]
MKKSFCFSILLLLLCFSSTLLAQNLLSSRFTSFDQDTLLQARLLYNPNLSNSFSFKYSADTDWGLNRRINQEFKTSTHNWQTTKYWGRVGHTNIIDYRKSEYNSSTSSSDKILTDSGSIGQLVAYSISDSLVLRGRMSYIYAREEHTASNKEFLSQGISNNAEVNFNSGLWGGRLSALGVYDDKFTDSKEYRKFISDLVWNYTGESIFIKVWGNYVLNREKIIATDNESEEYIVADDQTTDNLTVETNYSDTFGDYIPFSFENSFRSSSYQVDNSVLKNSDDWINDSRMTVSLPFSDTFSLNSEFFYSYFDKSYESGSGSRTEETRRALGGFTYNFRGADSLDVNYSRQLFRRNYQNSEQDADKDNMIDYFNSALRMFITKAVYTELLFAWNRHEEIYIKGTFSGNNNTKTVWDLQPKVKFMLHDKLMLSQEYQLYASYKDYIFSEESGFTDRFYRKFKAEYALTWNNQPLITQDSAFRKYALRLPIKQDYFQTEVRYSYAESEDGSKTDDHYSITVRNLDNSLEWEFKGNYNDVLTTLTPKFEWGDDEKLEVTLSSVANFAENSYVRLRVNPEFEKGDESIWEMLVELEYTF